MRKTSFYLDPESTIISMLVIGDKRPRRASFRGAPILKVLLGCAALLLVVVYWQGGIVWQ